MKKIIYYAALPTLIFLTQAAWASDQEKDTVQNLNDTNIDHSDLNDGFNAIRNKDPQTAFNKADAIIKRFEADEKDDVHYVCTSGTSDTLTGLLGFAVAANQGKQDKSKTSTNAVSIDICDAYSLKGFALIDLQRRDEALPSLQTAVKMDSDNTQYINELAEWYKGSKDWETSLSLFTLASNTNDLSIIFMDDKKLSKQILDARRCRSYRGIAFNHAEMKNWKKARKAAKECLKLIPDDPDSLRELEYIKQNKGKK